MGTGYDCSDLKAHTAARSITEGQRRWRNLLVTAMAKQGFVNYAKEWWHFSLPGAGGPAYDFPVTARGWVCRRAHSGVNSLFESPTVRAAMTQATFATHEVLNQSPPLVDVDLFALDRALSDAVAANGGASAKAELSEFGRHWGSAAMAERGRLANENTPKLRTFDSRFSSTRARKECLEFRPKR